MSARIVPGRLANPMRHQPVCSACQRWACEHQGLRPLLESERTLVTWMSGETQASDLTRLKDQAIGAEAVARILTELGLDAVTQQRIVADMGWITRAATASIPTTVGRLLMALEQAVDRKSKD